MTDIKEPEVIVLPDRRWEVILEDWKMTKDRISNFDNAVITIRIYGIPIVLVIIGIGLTSMEKLKTITIPIINCNGAALPFLFAAIYTIPLCLLDILHYKLLIKAVNHANKIEESKPFKDLLGISKTLTSTNMTHLHTISLIALYGTIFSLSILLTYKFW
ncbi:MAG: hypothetical protein ABR887_00760 [Methanoregulaceae archaeon]|jgi:uncharacterized Tic20 family protein